MTALRRGNISVIADIDFVIEHGLVHPDRDEDRVTSIQTEEI